MSKELRNEVSGVRTEDLARCVDIMGQLEESFRGNKSFVDAWNDELYRSVYRLEIESLRRSSRHKLRKVAYKDVCDMGKLLRVLYNRMTTFYNYGYADGAELPGISWSMENNGVFVISLKGCAVNMVHSLVGKDEDGLAQRGIAFGVWLDVPDMEADEDEDPFCIDRNFCKYVGFTCDFDGEYKDVTFETTDVDDGHLELVRDILADFDMIDEMVGEGLKK